jgi:hypothetical protein
MTATLCSSGNSLENPRRTTTVLDNAARGGDMPH